MVVSRKSWHFNLVKHKSFVSESKCDNKDATNYIAEVILSLWLITVFGLMIFTTLIGIASAQPGSGFGAFIIEYKKIVVIIFAIFITLPIWSCIFLIIIEPLTKKSWRRLRITGRTWDEYFTNLRSLRNVKTPEKEAESFKSESSIVPTN
ncbi:MAG: hypothetical protein WDK96_00255 [Candidatus Paceibacterota bacterium]|jgi:hypothetical protein